jgi:hypothetical protein
MHEALPTLNEGANETAIGVSVLTEPFRCHVDRSVQQDGLRIIERVGQGQRRVNPLKAVGSQIEGPKEGGRERQRVNGGTDIVAKTRKGEIFGAHPTPNGPTCLKEEDGTPHPGEGYRGGKAVGAGAHHHRIVFLSMSALFYWHGRASSGR